MFSPKLQLLRSVFYLYAITNFISKVFDVKK